MSTGGSCVKSDPYLFRHSLQPVDAGGDADCAVHRCGVSYLWQGLAQPRKPGQLHAAHFALTELGLADHPLISLAKREEWIHTPSTNEPIAIPHHEPALRLMQHIRNEAHRFGLRFHRQKRSKAMLTSGLDAIPGLGKVRQQKLLEHFGSLKRIQGANLDQLVKVIGKKTGKTVYDFLRSSV